jgi:hypothetical protein
LARDADGAIYAIWVRKQNAEETGTFSLVVRWKTPGNAWSGEYLVYEALAYGVSTYSFAVDGEANCVLLTSESQLGQPFTYHCLTLSLGEVIDQGL